MSNPIKFKKLTFTAKLPTKGTLDSAGVDLYCDSIVPEQYTQTYSYHTGVAVEIPNGYVGLLFPRSSIYKTVLELTNCVGVIDSDYRGELVFKFINRFDPSGNLNHNFRQFSEEFYNRGDRIGQLLIVPCLSIEPIEATELSSTDRGDGGFGSTGK